MIHEYMADWTIVGMFIFLFVPDCAFKKRPWLVIVFGPVVWVATLMIFLGLYGKETTK